MVEDPTECKILHPWKRQSTLGPFDCVCCHLLRGHTCNLSIHASEPISDWIVKLYLWWSAHSMALQADDEEATSLCRAFKKSPATHVTAMLNTFSIQWKWVSSSNPIQLMLISAISQIGSNPSFSPDRRHECVLVRSPTHSHKLEMDGLMTEVHCNPSLPFIWSLCATDILPHHRRCFPAADILLQIEDASQDQLCFPSSLPELASLDVSCKYPNNTHFHNPSKVEVSIDGIPRYHGEADDINPSLWPHHFMQLPFRLACSLSLLTDDHILDGSGSSKWHRGGKCGTGNQSNSLTDNQVSYTSLPHPHPPLSIHTFIPRVPFH